MQSLRECHGIIDGDFPELIVRHRTRVGPKTEEGYVLVREVVLDGVKVGKVRVSDLPDLGMGNVRGFSADGRDRLHLRFVQTITENQASDHACGTHND